MNDPRNEASSDGNPGGCSERLQVHFLTSAPGLRQCPPADTPEVAFAGRSNAGKSSVLNRLTGSRNTAKVSKTPGRTQLLNFFAVAGNGRVVDLPGYGYAKAGRRAQSEWQRSVNDYLSNRDCLAGVVLVTDIRHPGQPFDVEVVEWAVASELPLLILLNKADKLKRNAQLRALRAMQDATPTTPSMAVLLFSASSGQGNDEAVCWVRERFKPGPGDEPAAG